MIVAIHQPNFLPWLGYFDKLLRSDVFVLFDDVQFPRGKTFANRVLIKTPQGEHWITVPVSDKGDLHSIRETKIAPDPTWRRKMVRSLEVNYAKAPFTKQYLPGLKSVLDASGDNIYELNTALIRWAVEALDGHTQLVASSELCAGEPEMDGAEKIHFLLKKTGATTYITGSGAGSKRYIDEEWFNREGIALQWQHFAHPVYPQVHGPFIEKLSIVDLIFHAGPGARKILLNNE